MLILSWMLRCAAQIDAGERDDDMFSMLQTAPDCVWALAVERGMMRGICAK